MQLELNLVKIASVESKVAKLLVRKRVNVEGDTQALEEITKFIKENNSTFVAVLSDQVFVNKLNDLSSLTIDQFTCLRWMLATKGVDIWYQYVSDAEVNKTDVPTGVFEYNIVDSTNITGQFIPFTSKITVQKDENNFTNLYSSILSLYGLFEGSIFEGIRNPLESIIKSMKDDENVLGTVPTSKTTYCNSVFEFLKKDIKVITE